MKEAFIEAGTMTIEQFDYALLTTLPTRLRTVLSADDHKRGCQGREYVCTCGYDDKIIAITNEAAEAIENLRADRDSHQRLAIELMSSREQLLHDAADKVRAHLAGMDGLDTLLRTIAHDILSL